MRPWQRKLNVDRRNLRVAVKELAAVLEQRAARCRVEGTARATFRPLSDSETVAELGPALLAELKAAHQR